jgi:hypothetical protein
MAMVAVLGFDFAALKRLGDVARGHWSVQESSAIASALTLGVLPMVNILGFVLLVDRRDSRGHAFLLGFVTFGGLGLVLYLGATFLFAREFFLSYFSLQRNLLETVFEGLLPTAFRPRTSTSLLKAFLIAPLAVGIHLLLLLILALIGGLASHLGRSLLGELPRAGPGSRWLPLGRR